MVETYADVRLLLPRRPVLTADMQEHLGKYFEMWEEGTYRYHITKNKKSVNVSFNKKVKCYFLRSVSFVRKIPTVI